MVGNTKQKILKTGRKGAWPSSRDLILNSGTSLLSLVRIKLQTSDFADRLRVRDTKQKIFKWARRERGPGHVTYFKI